MDSATACKERHDGMSSALNADDGWNALSDACRYDSWWIVSSCWLTYRSSCFPAAGNKKRWLPFSEDFAGCETAERHQTETDNCVWYIVDKFYSFYGLDWQGRLKIRICVGQLRGGNLPQESWDQLLLNSKMVRQNNVIIRQNRCFINTRLMPSVEFWCFFLPSVCDGRFFFVDDREHKTIGTIQVITISYTTSSSAGRLMAYLAGTKIYSHSDRILHSGLVYN